MIQVSMKTLNFTQKQNQQTFQKVTSEDVKDYSNISVTDTKTKLMK